jgi:hypothetical protein
MNIMYCYGHVLQQEKYRYQYQRAIKVWQPRRAAISKAGARFLQMQYDIRPGSLKNISPALQSGNVQCMFDHPACHFVQKLVTCPTMIR